MGSMERSFTDQSTLQEDERMALSFMDAHTCGTRSKINALSLTHVQYKPSLPKPDARHPWRHNLFDRHSFSA